MIKIKKSQNADTRTCDWSKVTKEELLKDSEQHINDVQRGILFFIHTLSQSAQKHDYTKIIAIDEFHKDFSNGFKEGYTSWWEAHQKVERHHLKNEAFIQEDVNLIDILEQITDGVMAGLARSGEYRQEPISQELLKRAYDNTVKLLLANVKVIS